MAKLRHIAIAVKDPEAAATFFEQAFGMTRAGNAMRGVYMTDGIMNVALLNFAEEPVPGFESQAGYEGLIHFGMWVDSVEEVGYIRRILEQGNGADRQLRVFAETGDLKQVVDYMIEETETGLFEPAPAASAHHD